MYLFFSDSEVVLCFSNQRLPYSTLMDVQDDRGGSQGGRSCLNSEGAVGSPKVAILIKGEEG